ncbi:Phytanoyl-CoA dioxygenase (PhyH) [compost metagenome]
MSTELSLPSLTETYQLNEQQISNYQHTGHTILRNVATPDEISTYRDEIAEAVKTHSLELKPLSERDTYGKAFIQVSNLWETNKAVQQFVWGRRFAKIAAELMGVDGVRIYHDQALFKEPGGGHTPWHQDQIYWPLDTSKVITMWMPLVDISEEMGSMTFASGSHHFGYINKMEISDESHQTLKDYIVGKGLETVTYGAMQAGDATFHEGWTLHSAPGNPTPRTREIMTIIYVADQTRILEPDSNARKRDLLRWMPGQEPGELIGSALNPLVYHVDMDK